MNGTTWAWVLLVVAGLFEVIWAVGLKCSDGFTRPWVLTGTVVAFIISFLLLGLAMRPLSVGTAYAFWTGIGALGTAIVGMLSFGEPASAGRLLFLA